MKNKHINQLDVFRGLAALSVCASHFGYNSFFYNYFGNVLFVQLFFTLSGFVIAYNYYSNLKNFKVFLKFTIKRFKRLYPLHLFFLLVFLIVEIIKHILYSKVNILPNNSSIPFEYNNLKNFILNLFLLQHFATELSFNNASWSISVEMMLYLTFGITLLIFKNKFLLICFYLAYIIFFILFLSTHYGDSLSISAFYSGLYSFAVGFLFYLIFKNINFFFRSRIYIDLIFYTLILIFLYEIFYLHLIKSKYLYSLIFGLIFLFSCFLDKKFFLFKIFFNSFFIFLGKISYSIYMSHLLIFSIFHNVLIHVLKYQTKLDQGKIILDLDTFEANFYTLIIYILVIISSNFTYKKIEIKYYKK